MLRSLIGALLALGPAVGLAQTIATPAPDFSLAPVAAGTWTYQALPGASEARFIDGGGTARLVIRCTKATRRVSFSPTSAVPAATFFVWTSTASRTVAARFEANAMRVTADFAAFDALLDAIAFSRGRISVMVAGGSALVLPAWPEAARTIEDCRN
ncbi:MAG: hypothetical protein ABIN68_06355 [Sphingomicrobium sp.]